MHRIEETIARGMCIGCGACNAASGGAISVSLSPMRLYQAELSGASEDEVRAGSRVCPFSDEAPSEDELRAPQGDERMAQHAKLGQFSQTFAGRVSDDSYVRDSSSGGLTSWLLEKLVEARMVDAAINVGTPGPSNRELFGYDIAEVGQMRNRRKSQYYASSMAEVLAIAQTTGKRYAVIGVPCYIKAVRALCRERPELSDSLVVFVGLVCGHLKTQAFAESLAWQVGIAPAELDAVDFRVKSDWLPANRYNFGAKAREVSDWKLAPTSDLIGGNWGHSAFQPEACNFCDDVVGETADVSFGDAWLPRFTSDTRGTNIVISRNRKIDSIFSEARDTGEIEVLPLTPEEAAQSQAGGFRYRREGLALRLADDLAAGLSVPRKRVAPNLRSVSPRRAGLLRQRRKIARVSHVAFAEAVERGDLTVYLSKMKEEISIYRRIEGAGLKRLLKYGKKLMENVMARRRASRAQGSGGSSELVRKAA